jgi:hypothetical protein
MKFAMKLAPLLLAMVFAAATACQPSFEHYASTRELVVTLCNSSQPSCTNNRGGPSLDQRLPISFSQSQTFQVRIEAHNADGTLDTTFNGFVRASITPGTVLSVTTPPGGALASGRNVQLQNGVADNVSVEVVGGYGDSRIWMEDLGYVPADPARQPPPQCSDGIDNNKNGRVDFPVDPGCAYANDDTEDGGSFAAGATDVIYYLYPRIADVRGVATGGSATPFPFEQVQIDTQWFGTTEATRAGVVVTRVSSTGFYVTDIGETRGDSSVFAYNYTSPPRMRVCDRLISFGGTTSDFYGFTEVGFPTWILEEWAPIDPMHPDPSQRPCLVPEPAVILPTDTANTTLLLNVESALVRVATNPVDTDLPNPSCKVDADCAASCQASAVCRAKGTPLKCGGGQMCIIPVSLHVASHFGPSFLQGPNYTADADTSDCDFNRDGKIEFTGGAEQACSDACTADPECSEYSQYLGFNQFRLVVQDAETPPTIGTILADSSTSVSFDPVASKGKTLSGFTGTLNYFSGGAQFTIQARCDDDIVADPSQPVLSSTTACVRPRTISDVNQF